MISLVLHLYLLLFPRCEIMVSFLTDFTHCNDSPAWANHCYATSDWDYGDATPTMPLTHFAALEALIIKMPLVQTVSCWK
jgi:hypothetical protein